MTQKLGWEEDRLLVSDLNPQIIWREYPLCTQEKGPMWMSKRFSVLYRLTAFSASVGDSASAAADFLLRAAKLAAVNFSNEQEAVTNGNAPKGSSIVAAAVLGAAKNIEGQLLAEPDVTSSQVLER